MDAWKLHHAAERLYHFFWHYYADTVIESLKPRLALPDGSADKETAQSLLLEFHTTLVVLLHPFMPFITEEIWRHLPQAATEHKSGSRDLLIVQPWPAR
jgi:valyl-tRNA synthetase